MQNVPNKTVKPRKVANTTVIPSDLKIPVNANFEPSVNDHGDIIFKRVDTVSTQEKQDIKQFMSKYQPLMDHLKDK